MVSFARMAVLLLFTSALFAQTQSCPTVVNNRFAHLSVYQGESPLETTAVLRDPIGKVIRELRTNPEGEVALGHIEEGEYTIGSATGAATAWGVCIHALASSENQYVDVDLLSESPRSAPLPLKRIVGTVKDHTGAVIAGAIVRLTRIKVGSNLVLERATSQDGVFVLDAPDGMYDLKILAQGFGPRIFYLALSATNKDSKPLEVRMRPRHHMTAVEVTQLRPMK